MKDWESEFRMQKSATIERLVREGIPRPMVVAWIESYEGGDADLHREYGGSRGVLGQCLPLHSTRVEARAPAAASARHLERRPGSRAVTREPVQRDTAGRFGSGKPPAQGRPRLTPVQLQQMHDYRRAALRGEFVTDGIPEAFADRWIDAWIAKGEGDPAGPLFWSRAYAWITSEAAAGLEPPAIGDSTDRESGPRDPAL